MEKVSQKNAEFFRILQKDDNFVLEFAKKDGDEMSIVARVEIEASKLLDCTVKMLNAGMTYQKETGKDIGFPKPENK